MIVQQDDEEEKDEELEAQNPNSLVSHSKNLEEVLLKMINNIEDVTQVDFIGEEIVGSVSDKAFVPLGQQRLRTVELVLKMIQLKNDNINEALNNSRIFSNVVNLVQSFPWNNFL